MLEIYYSTISLNYSYHDEILMRYISSEKQQRINRYERVIDKKLSLYAEILVLLLFFQKCHCKMADVAIEKGKNGKPYFRDFPDFNYNISHTNNAIAVAISDRAIGIDIERFGKVDMNIAKRFFSNNEREYILENVISRDKRFFEIWTKKEALVKCIGCGLSLHLNKLDVVSDREYWIDSYEINEYIVSICSEDNKVLCYPIYIPEDKIISQALNLFPKLI